MKLKKTAVPRSDQLVESLQLIFDNLSGFSWREFSMGMSFIFLLLVFQWLSRNVRRLHFLKALGPLTVCLLSIWIMNEGGFYKVPASPAPAPSNATITATTAPAPGPAAANTTAVKPPSAPIKSIGKIPSGLPDFTGDWWLPLISVSHQVVLAALICLLDVCESISIAKALAQKNGYELNYTQELRGLGYANIAGALFNCYTTTGSFSRSAVNNSVGAKTPLSSLTTGLTIMVVLLCLTSVFTNMSQNVQGAIIIVGVLQLFDYKEFIALWRINKVDWCIWVVTFLFTIFLGVEVGIGVGIGVSLFVVLLRSAFPNVSTLGRIPDTRTFRAKKLYPDVEETPEILIVKPEARIVFASVDPLRTKINRAIKERLDGGEKLKYLILDLVAVDSIDATGIHWLEAYLPELQIEKGLHVVVANPNRQMLVDLKRADLIDVIGEENIHVNLRSAVHWAQLNLDRAVSNGGEESPNESVLPSKTESPKNNGVHVV